MPPGIYTVTYLLNDYKEVIIPDVDLTVTPAVIEDLGTTELFVLCICRRSYHAC